MPSTATATMLALHLNNRLKEINDQIFYANPLSAWLHEKKAVEPWTGGGENIEPPLQTTGNTTMAARDYKTPIDLQEMDPITYASLASRLANGAIVWYQWQEESNQGAEYKIKPFVQTLVDNGKSSLADVIAREMWQDGQTNHFHGLPTICSIADPVTSSTANTYAGILGGATVATGSYWAPNDTNASFTTIVRPTGPIVANTYTVGAFHTAEALVIEGGTDGGIRGLYNACCDNGGTDGPDFGVTTEALYNKILSLVGAERIRYNERMAEIGFPENLQYKGATIVWDRNCGTAGGTPQTGADSSNPGPFYFLNSKYLKLMPYGDYAAGPKTTPPENKFADGVSAYVILMQWRGNLLCKRRQRVGRLTGKYV